MMWWVGHWETSISWGDECANGRWGALWDREGGNGRSVTGNVAAPWDVGWMREQVRGRKDTACRGLGGDVQWGVTWDR